MARRTTSVFARLALVPLLGAAFPAQAQDAPDINWQADFGLRNYTDDGLFRGQSDAGTYPFFGLAVDGGFALGPGEIAFDLSGVLDDANGRTSGKIDRLYYRQSTGAVDYLFGFNTENWGVVESRSIVNVMNPRDTTDPLARSDLTGTPMLNANIFTDYGTVSAYALTGFVGPVYGEQGRTRLRLPVEPDYGNPVYEEGDGRHLDVALRYSNNFSLGAGALDVSASYFNGTDRAAGCTTGDEAVSCTSAVLGAIGPLPPGAPGPDASSDEFWDWMAENATDELVEAVSGIDVPGLSPYHQKIQQVGVTAVYAYEDLQLRFEGTVREASDETSYAAVVGGDYTWNDITAGGASLTMAVEYLYDDRDENQPLTLFEDDVFLGLDYRLNNASDTRFQLGVFHDLSSEARLYRIEMTTRLNDRMGLSLNAAKAETDGYNDPLSFLRNDGYVELKLSTYF